VPREQPLEAAWQPRKLGRYWLLDTIGNSRFGGVYQALLRLAGKPDRLLAIKRVSAQLSRDQLFSAHFLDVMARASELKHPAQCTILNCGRADGSLCVVMEWVPGKNLAEIALELRERGEAMPPRLVAYIGSQIADVLDAAHHMARGGQSTPLCHGDLALTNILIGYDGRVRLTGLGSAELQAAAANMTGRGYRAPELAQGFPCDARSDVFSLGACLYELLVGEPPSIARSDLKGGSKPESSIRRLIPRPLDQIVSRALAAHPGARWQSAAEMARAFDRLSSDDGEPQSPKTLGAFLRALFEAVLKGEQLRLDALLSRVAAANPTETGAHAIRSDAPPARAGSQPPQPPSVRPPPPSRRAREARVDLSELTPPRGYLMEQLAAEMHEETRPAPADPSSPAPISSVPQASAVAPAPSAPPLPLPLPLQLAHAQQPVRARASMPVMMALAGVLALGALALWLGNAGTDAPAKSALVVRTHPSGAEVFVRGKRLGTTPLSSTELESGSLLVELRAAGFETVTRTIELQPGKAIELDLDLRRREAPVVSAQPPEAIATPVADARDTPSKRDHRRRRSVGSRSALVDEPAEEAEVEEPSAADETTLAMAPESAPQAAPLPAPAPSPPAPVVQAAQPPAPQAAESTSPKAPAPRAAVARRVVTREAELIERASPKFPPRAKRLDVYEGMVLIEFTIDRNGLVRDPKVAQAKPSNVFEDTALDAIQKFRFRPKLVDNVPVESRSRFTFRFKEEQ
jgi:TonB family protein